MHFAFKNYACLADSDLSAEAVAREAWKLWEIERETLLNEEQSKIAEIKEKINLVNERDNFKAKVNELERQRAVSFGWRFLFGIGWAGLIFPGFLGLAVYTSLVASIAYATALHRLL